MKVSETHNLLTCYPEVAKSIDFEATMKVWEQNPKKYAHVTCLEDCSKITPQTDKRAIFKCLKNPEHNNWDTTIYKRTDLSTGCPQCAGRVASKENNLLVCYPEIAESIDFKKTLEACKEDPKKYIYITCLEDCSKIMPSTNKRAIFKCLKNPEHDNWDAQINWRTSSKRTGCSQCANKVASKENNLFGCYPEVAKSIDFDATMKAWEEDPKKYAHLTCLEDCAKITSVSGKRAIFKCLKNPEHDNWSTQISHRTSLKRGCPQCGLIQRSESCMKTILKNNNILLVCHPEVAKSIDFDATMKA